MKDILFLRKMITPKLALLCYWIISVLIVIEGSEFLYISAPYYFGLADFFVLLGILAILIATRITFELIILFFNMYAELKKIRSFLESNGTTLTEELTYKKSQEPLESQDE